MTDRRERTIARMQVKLLAVMDDISRARKDIVEGRDIEANQKRIVALEIEAQKIKKVLASRRQH